MKKVIKRKDSGLETTILWLSNTLRLLHTLKQYSGETIFQEENTPVQNVQSLQNFDLYEYRQVLSDQAVWMYQVRDRVRLSGCPKRGEAAPLELFLTVHYLP